MRVVYAECMNMQKCYHISWVDSKVMWGLLHDTIQIGIMYIYIYIYIYIYWTSLSMRVWGLMSQLASPFLFFWTLRRMVKFGTQSIKIYCAKQVFGTRQNLTLDLESHYYVMVTVLYVCVFLSGFDNGNEFNFFFLVCVCVCLFLVFFFFLPQKHAYV